jgi:hypothetical protein
LGAPLTYNTTILEADQTAQLNGCGFWRVPH